MVSFEFLTYQPAEFQQDGWHDYSVKFYALLIIGLDGFFDFSSIYNLGGI